MKKKAFTLAEVLITLGIIGVVAALTIPSLIAKHKEKETVSKLKNIFSTLSNAYTLILNEHDSPENWGFPDIPGGHLGDNSFEGTSIIREKFIPYLKVSKLCETSNCSDTGTPTAGIILSNGSVITFQRRINSAGCTHTRLIAGTSVPICAVINVNTNGFKPPNKSGEDIFQFWMTPNSIIPTGLQGDSEFDYCKRGIDGYGCAAWVIYNENMDYLHCNDLSWEGKTKCN